MVNVRNKVKDGMKICNICGDNKPVKEYYKYKNGIRGHCKKCNYEMCKESRDKRDKSIEKKYYKKYWSKQENKIKKYKSSINRRKKIKEQGVNYLGGKCSICGYDKCIEALEFHHKVSSTKDKEMCRGNGLDTRMSFNKLKEELDKCTLLCSNCHREVHYEQRQQNIDSV
jgi:hypothetical protein